MGGLPIDFSCNTDPGRGYELTRNGLNVGWLCSSQFFTLVAVLDPVVQLLTNPAWVGLSVLAPKLPMTSSLSHGCTPGSRFLTCGILSRTDRGSSVRLSGLATPRPCGQCCYSFCHLFDRLLQLLHMPSKCDSFSQVWLI